MKKIILIGCFCLATFVSLAQSPGPTPDPDPVGAPVDGGVGLLAAAGIAYGAKKLRDKRKEKNKEE